MKTLIRSLIAFSIILNSAGVSEATTGDPGQQTWKLKSLKKIGGHKVLIFGNPEVVKTDPGKAIKFDGVDDRIMIDNNPISGAEEFTVEVIFKADPAYEISNQPRFIHIQDPDDSLMKRVMVELRLTPDNEWYLDGYMQTDSGNRTLVNSTLTHPVGDWDHVALTFKGNTFTTYVNGIKEMTGQVLWKNKLVNERARVSVGGRMNGTNYYKGMIKTLRVTHKALEPDEFMKF